MTADALGFLACLTAALVIAAGCTVAWVRGGFR